MEWFLFYKLVTQTFATFVPDVCLKNLHRWVLVKRYGIYDQLDGSVELCDVAKNLEKMNRVVYRD